jgi:hypothetical protein
MEKLMNWIVNKLTGHEGGTALLLALILLGVGSVIIAPLLNFMGTGLMITQTYETKMQEYYAAEAGIGEQIYSIITLDAPSHVDLQNLSVNDTIPYNLTELVNGQAVSTTTTKLSLLANYLDPDEYKEGQPHENWVGMSAPAPTNRTGEYVEYNPEILFHYDGVGTRSIETIGVVFAPLPRGDDKIDGPYDVVYTPVLTSDFLEADTPKAVTGIGSFAFTWRWQKNKGPVFDINNRDGTFSFKFKIWEPDWSYGIYFVWATFKEQDISYATNAPGTYNWWIQAIAGNTKVRTYILANTNYVHILTWEIASTNSDS